MTIRRHSKPFSEGWHARLYRQSLAYAEMRLLLVKLLFNFYWEVPGQEDLHDRCRGFSGVWEKPPLKVNLRKRKYHNLPGASNFVASLSCERGG